MLEHEFAAAHPTDEAGHLHRFRYSLLTETVGSSPIRCEVYGIRIAEEGGRDSCLSALTTSLSQISALLTRLSRNCVGPSGLADVVEDWKKESAG